jgi:hypothetical protein
MHGGGSIGLRSTTDPAAARTTVVRCGRSCRELRARCVHGLRKYYRGGDAKEVAMSIHHGLVYSGSHDMQSMLYLGV